MPSRTPRPESEIGTTWAIATAGTNASDAPRRHADVERVRQRSRPSRPPRSGTRARSPSTPTPARRSRRRRVDAHVDRADEAGPVLVVREAAGGLGVAGEEEDRRRARRAMPGRPAARPTRARRRAATGRCAKPIKHEQRQRDEAGEPFEHDRPRTRSRSSRCPSALRLTRTRRRRSSTAARCRRTARRSSGVLSRLIGTCTSNTASTRCHRQAERTMPSDAVASASGEPDRVRGGGPGARPCRSRSC